jgi:hypothetical protein
VTIPEVVEVFGTGGILISWGALIGSADEKDMFPWFQVRPEDD